jgi:hypothetical protein
MAWWMELVLLISGLMLWFRSGERQDDVWEMFQKLIAVVMVVVVLLGGRWVPLEVAALGLAIWLPCASRFDRSDGV